MIRREPHQSIRQPYRLGAILDWPLPAVRRDVQDVLHFCFAEALAAKRLDRPVDLLVREFDGPPQGSALAVAEAWRSLARDEQVQLILGPHTDEAARVVAQAMRDAGHPTLSACNGSGFSSDFGVTLGLGNAADEAVLLADLHRARGHRVAVLADLTPAGEEALRAFELHAREAGVAVVATVRLLAPDDPSAIVEGLRAAQAAGAEGLQIFADPASLAALVTGVAAAGTACRYHPRIVLGSAYAAHRVVAGLDPAAMEGWAGIDLLDERNGTATAFLDRFAAVQGRRPAHAWALVAHDLAQVAIQALPSAKPPSPDGVRVALDRLRFWPAAAGSAGTLISIAPYDHRAYKGPYLVLREFRGGVDGRLDVPTRFAA